MGRVLITTAILTSLLLHGCGGNDTETEYRREDPPTPNPPSGGRAISYAEIQPLLKQSCGGASCHPGASFLQLESKLRSNLQVRKRIASDSMPPSFADNYYLWENGARKQKVLEFLSN